MSKEKRRVLKLLDGGHIKSMETLEREIYVNALEYYEGNVLAVIEYLRVTRSTLYRRMNALKVNPNDFREQKYTGHLCHLNKKVA